MLHLQTQSVIIIIV